MAELCEKSFPFDSNMESGEYDRVYVADDFARYFRAFISSGLFMKQSTNLQVISNGDMTVTLKAGSIIIDGYRYENESDITIPITPADGILDRIDRICITWSKADRDIHYIVQEGTASYSPQPVNIRRNSDFKDYVVAEVYVAAGVVSISQANITDTRLNSELCGLAIPFTEIDTTTLYNQIQTDLTNFKNVNEAEFLEWMETEESDYLEWIENLKIILDETTAGHLQNEIDEITTEIEKITTDVSNLKGTELINTLTSGATSLIFTDDSITENSTFDFYTDDYGVTAKSVTKSGNSLTMTFKAQSKDVKVKVVVKNGMV